MIEICDSLEWMNNSQIKFKMIVTSPPYNVGKEYEEKKKLEVYISWFSPFIKEMHKILDDNGILAINVGNYIDSGAVYPLDCILFSEFIKIGFIPRGRIVWTFGHGLHAKKRFSGRHEVVLIFSKSEKYYFNLDAVRTPSKYPCKKHYKGPKKGQLSGNPLGKNPGDVWDIPNVKHNHPEKTSHPCQFPEAMIERLLLAHTVEGDLVLDPFAGSGTVGAVAKRLNRRFFLIEKNPAYAGIIEKRINATLAT